VTGVSSVLTSRTNIGSADSAMPMVPTATAVVVPNVLPSAADTCRWVYYDRSPAGRSRWCTMSLCGARNKMRKYRARS
jgi:predicted RNA-binding Zn ribbon-like protein